MPTPEHVVKKRLKLLLNKYNCYWFMPIGGPYSTSGVPDFVGCHQGKFFGIETKAGKRKLTPLQAQQGEAIIAAGGAFFVPTDQNNDEFERLEQWLKN